MAKSYNLYGLDYTEFNSCFDYLTKLREAANAEEDEEDTIMDEQDYVDTPTHSGNNRLTGLTNAEWQIADKAVQEFRRSKRRVVIFTETGEIRPPKKGEYYFDDCFKWSEFDRASAYPIYTRTESFLTQETN